MILPGHLANHRSSFYRSIGLCDDHVFQFLPLTSINWVGKLHIGKGVHTYNRNIGSTKVADAMKFGCSANCVEDIKAHSIRTSLIDDCHGNWTYNLSIFGRGAIIVSFKFSEAQCGLCRVILLTYVLSERSWHIWAALWSTHNRINAF
jgi:hypothetical protein